MRITSIKRNDSAAPMRKVSWRSSPLPCLDFELLNVAGRSWHLQARRLTELADLLVGLDFEWTEPELKAVARWTAQGLTAYDSTYVALAEQLSTPLITADKRVTAVAGVLAQRLADVE